MNVSAKHSTRDVNVPIHQTIAFKNFIRNVPFQIIAGKLLRKLYYFFCKDWQKKSYKNPLRFRLGSLNYCNQLEGKAQVVRFHKPHAIALYPFTFIAAPMQKNIIPSISPA